MKQRDAVGAISTSQPEVRARLKAFVSLLDRWRSVTNLISNQGFEEVWTRHIADCLQLLDVSGNQLRWLDIGSGAGFPGLIIAIQLVGQTNAIVHCVEKDGRKCAFLRHVARELALPAIVHNCRIESLQTDDIGNVGVITARAFSSLGNILGLARPYLASGSFALLLRGKTVDDELEQLPPGEFSIDRLPNRVYSDGSVLKISLCA